MNRTIVNPPTPEEQVFLALRYLEDEGFEEEKTIRFNASSLGCSTTGVRDALCYALAAPSFIPQSIATHARTLLEPTPVLGPWEVAHV